MQHRETETDAIDQRLFPAASRRGNSCGKLKLQELKASELVAQHGSPLYVIDEQEARTRARGTRVALEQAFAGVGGQASVYYASKAFLCVEVAQWMHEEGLGIDVASGGELAVALAAHVPPSRIALHGNNKSPDEIARAVTAGVGSIVLDSEEEIGLVAAAARDAGTVQRVLLRVNNGVHASTHDYLATSHEDQKFGVPLPEAVRLVREIRAEPALEFRGLHCHIGSQIFAVDGFAESARRLIDLYPELLTDGPVPELNLGGGFGIAHTPEEIAEVPSINTLAEAIAQAVHRACQHAGIAMPQVSFEPGRSIIGPAGVTLYTVGSMKQVQIPEPAPADSGHTVRTYVSVDGGMSDNARPALYDAPYTVTLASRRSGAPAMLTRIAGKHCEAGDILISHTLLPGDLRRGDLLAVPATGAYCWSLSSNYNYVPRPPVIAVNQGTSRTIVRGQTEADLLAYSVTTNHDTTTETELQ